MGKATIVTEPTAKERDLLLELDDALGGFSDSDERVPLEGIALVPVDDSALTEANTYDLVDTAPVQAYSRFSPEILRGIDMFLVGATQKDAAKACGMHPTTLSRAINSPLGQSYIAEFYNQRKSWINALYTRALAIQADAMQSPQLSVRTKASETLLRHFGIRQDTGDESQKTANASDVARQLIDKFRIDVHIHEKDTPVIDITPKDD